MDDLAEKRRKLEEIRAAREAKKRLIEQHRLSKLDLPLSSEVLSFSEFSADSSSVQNQPSTSILAVNTVNPTTLGSPGEAVVQPPSQKPVACSHPSVDLTKGTVEDSKQSGDVVPDGAVSLSIDAPARPIEDANSTPEGESNAHVLHHRPSRRASSTQYDHKVPQTTDLPTQSGNRPESFDCFHRWGGLESLDYATPFPRAAEICALTPKICFGDERRLVIDIAVTTLLYRDGDTASGDNAADPQLRAGAGKSASGRESMQRRRTRSTQSLPCVAAAYSTPWTSFSNDPNSPHEAASDTMVDYPTEDLTMILSSSYAWGQAFSSPAGRPHTRRTLANLETVSAQLRQVPGLVMVWTIIPGAGIKEANVDGPFRDEVAASVGFSSQDLVVLTPLVCDTEVTTLMAHPFSPPGVLIAGTASGRLVMWNIAAAEWVGLNRKQLRARAVSSTGSRSVLVGNVQRPLASSFPSPQLHQGRVLALSVHGNPANHYLYSISQEGRVCTWLGWQTLQPIVARSAYFEGGVFMGNVGTVAVFAGQRGSDSMTKVYIGTSHGAVIEGLNRNDRTIELHRCGVGGKPISHTGTNSKEYPSDMPSNNRGLSELPGQFGTPSISPASPPLPSMGSLLEKIASSPLEHAQNRGPITAIAVQSSAFHVPFRDHDCVVAAFAHGGCVAYRGDVRVVLDGFVAMVTALRWSPTHPRLFAAGDREGVVSLWDIDYSLSFPLLSVCLDQSSGGFAYSSSSGIEAVVIPIKPKGTLGSSLDTGLSRTIGVSSVGPASPIQLAMDGTTEAVTSLTFSADGRWLFAGVTAGNVYVLELSEALARVSGRSESHFDCDKEEAYS